MQHRKCEVTGSCQPCTDMVGELLHGWRGVLCGKAQIEILEKGSKEIKKRFIKISGKGSKKIKKMFYRNFRERF